MARFNPHRNARPIHDAAQLWAQRCLDQDGSVFSDELRLWTPATLDELDRRFVQNLDEGEGDFFEKLETQLGGGSPVCRQLMSETLWILMLFQTNVGPGKKRANVVQVWSWSGADLPDGHPLLSDAVLNGLGSAGAAYNTQRWRELSFLISAVRNFKRLAGEERERILANGWNFAEWLSDVPGARNRQLRHILPHLLFPDRFERISSEKDKRLILAAHLGVPQREVRRWDLAKIDRELLNLREEIEKEYGREIDFYEDEFLSRWRDVTGTWLLSWNPENWDWGTLADDRAKTAAGEIATRAWRCASSAPREGDRVFLVRTGVEPKGIVAFGSVARAPYHAPHYNPDRAAAGETTQFIDVDFTSVRDATLDPIVLIGLLQRDARPGGELRLRGHA